MGDGNPRGTDATPSSVLYIILDLNGLMEGKPLETAVEQIERIQGWLEKEHEDFGIESGGYRIVLGPNPQGGLNPLDPDSAPPSAGELEEPAPSLPELVGLVEEDLKDRAASEPRAFLMSNGRAIGQAEERALDSLKGMQEDLILAAIGCGPRADIDRLAQISDVVLDPDGLDRDTVWSLLTPSDGSAPVKDRSTQPEAGEGEPSMGFDGEATLANDDRIAFETEPIEQTALYSIHETEKQGHLLYLQRDDARAIPNPATQIVQQARSHASPETALFEWPVGLVTEPSTGLLSKATDGDYDDFYSLAWVTHLKANRQLDDSERRWGARLRMALRLARGVSLLHSRGFVHLDLCAASIRCDPSTGGLTLGNPGAYSPEGSLRGDVHPPVRYAAPEQLESGESPSRETVRHSLAVLLFQLLLLHHPLEGPKVYSGDPDRDERLRYGTNAVYIVHPIDASNRPTALVHPRLLGRELERLFQQAFTEGLREPARRPTAERWEEAIWRLMDRVLSCRNPDCVMRHYPVTLEQGTLSCPWCGEEPSLDRGLPVLRFYSWDEAESTWTLEPDSYVVAGDGSTLHPWHVTRGAPRSPKQTDPVAQILHRDGGWRLENHSLKELRVLSGGAAQAVNPGTEVQLERGTLLASGSPEGGRLIYVQMLTEAYPPSVLEPSTVSEEGPE